MSRGGHTPPRTPGTAEREEYDAPVIAALVFVYAIASSQGAASSGVLRLARALALVAALDRYILGREGRLSVLARKRLACQLSSAALLVALTFPFSHPSTAAAASRQEECYDRR